MFYLVQQLVLEPQVVDERGEGRVGLLAEDADAGEPSELRPQTSRHLFVVVKT
jgi:hypothetical protein